MPRTNPGGLGPRYAQAALPAGEASLAYRRGDYERVVEILWRARRDLWQMGGSHAQRDLFFQIFTDAARRLGRKELLSLLIDEVRGNGFERVEDRASYAGALAALD